MKFLLIIFCALALCTHSALSLWEFAVTAKSKIIFYDDQWTEITTAAHQFDDLSAIAFDDVEEVIYFNDGSHNNGSIFSLKIPIGQDNDHHVTEKMVQRTQDERVGGIAYDPLTRSLFWTDVKKRQIYSMPVVEGSTGKPKVLLDFTDEETKPDGIAIDICRRKLYWTNSNFKNATVERAELDGSDREIIVQTNLYLPHGIVVDQLSDRIYWVVNQEGMHFSVESSNLDGSDRHVLVKGLSNNPFNLAVTNNMIYWTDLTNSAIWSHTKYHKINSTDTYEDFSPQKVRTFAEKPHGIVARMRFLKTLQNDQHCAVVVKKIKNRLLTPKPTQDPVDERIKKLLQDSCLNGGEYSEKSGMCICKMGFDGARCETDECYNYCVHGTCTMSSMGFRQCVCQKDFKGERCEVHKCTDYCLNNGECKIRHSDGEPTCNCKDNFGGSRCEHNSTEICSFYCQILKHDPETDVPYGCHDICEELAEQTENGRDIYALPQYKHLEVCQNSQSPNITIIVVSCGVVLSLVLVLLIVHGLRRFYKPARPRIRKTFVVKTSGGADTPLTNRPVGSEQCEITIENCCNMNICETPCFDPKLLQQNMTRGSSTKEDKKILINNIDDY